MNRSATGDFSDRLMGDIKFVVNQFNFRTNEFAEHFPRDEPIQLSSFLTHVKKLESDQEREDLTQIGRRLTVWSQDPSLQKDLFLISAVSAKCKEILASSIPPLPLEITKCICEHLAEAKFFKTLRMMLLTSKETCRKACEVISEKPVRLADLGLFMWKEQLDFIRIHKCSYGFELLSTTKEDLRDLTFISSYLTSLTLGLDEETYLSRHDECEFLRKFPNLKSYRCIGRVLRSFEDALGYLKQFRHRDPGTLEELNSSMPKLEGIELDTHSLSDGEMVELLKFGSHLKYLWVHSSEMETLDLDKFSGDSLAVGSSVKHIYCSGSERLKKITANHVQSLQISQCVNVESIEVKSAKSVTIFLDLGLIKFEAASAEFCHVQSCPKLISLHLPTAKKVICVACEALEQVYAPHAFPEDVQIQPYPKNSNIIRRQR